MTRVTGGFDVGEEPRQQADRRQEGTDDEDGVDAGCVGQLTEHRGPQSSRAERKTKEDAGHSSDATRHKFLREDHDGRERRREDQADDDGQDLCPEQVRVWQQQGERQRAEDRHPDHVLAPDAIAHRPADERPGSN